MPATWAKTKQIQTSMHPDTVAEFDARAEAEGISRSEAIRIAMDEWVERSKRRAETRNRMKVVSGNSIRRNRAEAEEESLGKCPQCAAPVVPGDNWSGVVCSKCGWWS